MSHLGDEATLLARAQQGDREAFWYLTAPSIDGIYGLARRMIPSDQDAEDLVQATCLHALRAIGEFTGQSRFAVWIHRIALDQILVKVRKPRSELFPVESLEGAQTMYPAPMLDWSEAARNLMLRRGGLEALERAIVDLPVDLLLVVVLRDVNGLSREETAQVLDLPIGAVQQRLHRARNVLRDRLTGYFRERSRENKSLGGDGRTGTPRTALSSSLGLS